MKEGMTWIIIYNKRNNFLFQEPCCYCSQNYFSRFVSYMDGLTNIMAGDDASSLEGSVEIPLARWKFQNFWFLLN